MQLRGRDLLDPAQDARAVLVESGQTHGKAMLVQRFGLDLESVQPHRLERLFEFRSVRIYKK